MSHTALVTNLANPVQPIIRYDIADSIMVHEDPCSCGSLFPSIQVEGRDDVTLMFTTAAGAPVKIAGLAMATIVEKTPSVSRAQLVQTRGDRVEIRLDVADGADAHTVWVAVRNNLERFLSSHGLDAVVVERSPTTPQVDPRSGKFRAAWREIDFSGR